MLNLRMMDTLSETINYLQKLGYINSFEIKNGKFICIENNKSYQPSDLQILETYRFEGKSDPDDMSILFVLESNDKTKGLFIEAYGTYSLMEDSNSELVKQLKSKKTN